MAANAQLRALNPLVGSRLAEGSSAGFAVPTQAGRAPGDASCGLSSFGFSGTIAHGLFVHSTTGPAMDSATLASGPSLFRAAAPVLSARCSPGRPW